MCKCCIFVSDLLIIEKIWLLQNFILNSEELVQHANRSRRFLIFE
jgi:hypothetical protein